MAIIRSRPSSVLGRRRAATDARYRRGEQTKLIEAKVAGEEIVAPPAKEEGHIINLMDALRASVAKVQEKGAAADKPARKMAPSKGKEPAARRRQTS